MCLEPEVLGRRNWPRGRGESLSSLISHETQGVGIHRVRVCAYHVVKEVTKNSRVKCC